MITEKNEALALLLEDETSYIQGAKLVILLDSQHALPTLFRGYFWDMVGHGPGTWQALDKG